MTAPEKSAFDERIYGDLPPEFFAAGIDTTASLARLQNIMPKPYQAFDLFMSFYRPAEAAASSLKPVNKKAPAWLSFMRALLRRDEYLKVNRVTRGTMELAAAAAARFLATLINAEVQVGQKKYSLEALDEVINKIENNNPPPELRGEIQNAGAEEFLRQLQAKISEAAGEAATQLEQILKELTEYVEAKHEAGAAAAQLAGGFGYGLEGLSIWTFLKNADEFRRKVRLLSAAACTMRMFNRVLPTSLDHMYVESKWGGIDGVTQMRSYSQLPDIMPSELALMQISPPLFAVKLAQMSLTVYRRAAAVKPVVFIDKSGSMDEPLEGRQQIPKISLAAGLGLALYRRYNAAIYLFDTEMEKVSPKEVVKTLLSIRADGGTAIDGVLEEILKIGRRDYIYIIVTDGITEGTEETLKQLVTRGLARQMRAMLVPPGDEEGEWIKTVKSHGQVLRAGDVAEFMAAARQALTS
jgi:uncharacterized protein with von Willebrand factor type A (vWA) domain